MAADAELIKLLAWMSPSFPVGAFSYSHGIEWAVETGDISDRASLESWLGDVLRFGAGLTDAVVLLHAHEATRTENAVRLAAAAEFAAAFQPSRERALESHNQGAAFMTTVRAAWPAPGLALLERAWDGPIALPVAVGVATGAHGIASHPATLAYLHAFAANLVSAAVRLVPLGQTDGQRVIAAVEPTIAEVAELATSMRLDDVGGATLRSDIASMRHETQYTRLFRS